MSALFSITVAFAALQLVPSPKPQSVFAGEERPVKLVWHNPSDESVRIAIRARLLQATSATTAPVSETAWKELQLLSGQTVVESAAITFPAVRSATRFILQWLAGEGIVLGTTDVTVYPSNLLRDLQSLIGERVLGVLDPGDALKPALRAAEIDFADIGDVGYEEFSGPLVIVASESFGARQVQTLAKRGVAVVWIQTPPESPAPSTADEILWPSFFMVSEKKTGIVVVEPQLVADFAANPASQLTMIALARLALKPVPFALPQLHGSP